MLIIWYKNHFLSQRTFLVIVKAAYVSTLRLINTLILVNMSMVMYGEELPLLTCVISVRG